MQLTEKQEKTKKVLSGIHNLPTVANVMLETTKLLEDASTSTTKLAKIIGRDQGLATKLLAIANSPIYGIPRKVATIDFAILVLGYQEIKNIIIGLSIMETFKNMNDANLNYKNLWMHSYLVGSLARRLALDLQLKISGEAFISGLLHDLAIAVIHKYFHSAFLKIIEQNKENGTPFIESEREALGYTHEDIAYFLIERWNLPANICNVVLNHHEPSKIDGKPELGTLVHIADTYIHNWGYGDSFWDNNMSFDNSVFHHLNFQNIEELNSFMNKYKTIIDSESIQIKF